MAKKSPDDASRSSASATSNESTQSEARKGARGQKRAAKSSTTKAEGAGPAPKKVASSKRAEPAKSAPKKTQPGKSAPKKGTAKKAGSANSETGAETATSSTSATSRKKAAAKAEKARKKSLGEAVEVARKAGRDKATKKQLEKRDEQLSSFTAALRVGPGFVLADLDASSTPAFDAGHKKAEKLMRKTAGELEDLQERLYAGQRHPGGKSVLLLVQGMDTSGKGGIMRHVVSTMDPQGVELTSFKAPTKEELEHPFLWRIRKALPKPGYVGVFDRSQYEDVLVVRVHDLVSRPVWMRRYGQINAFEESAAAQNITMIKVMLHIDADEQKKRLAERLDNPEKHYKFNPGDLVERRSWPEYQEAYQALLERTSTEVAPWFVVPANNKWYARLAVQQLLLEHLRVMDLPWPQANFDVEEQKRILDAL